MNVNCDNMDCAHNKDGVCQESSVSLYDGECINYVSYRETPEYQNVYYKSLDLKDKDGVPEGRYKEKCLGKRIEVNGFVAFAEGKCLYNPERVNVTEERTGARCEMGHLATLSEEIRRRAAEIKDIKDFPEVEKIRGRYRIVEATNE